MELKALMEGFASKIGLTGLECSEEGAYALSFDNMDVGFTEDEPGSLLIAAPFAEKPAEGADRLAEILLSLNHLFATTAGSTIALDVATGEYVLQRRLPLALVDIDSFYEQIETFVNKLKSFRDLIKEFRPAFDKAEQVAVEDHAAAAWASLSGFTKV